MAPPSLSVIVPATHEPPTLEPCLAAIRAAGGEPVELIVEREPHRSGPAAARNAGAAKASAELLVFVDSDIAVHEDALDRIVRAFALDRNLSAVFGAYDDEPAAPGYVSRFRNLLHHHVHSAAPGEAETFWAGLGAVRREAFFAVGGFDAGRFPEPAVEDIEFGRRLRARGEPILLDPAIRGTHLKRWTLAGMVSTDLLRRGIPWARLQLEERRLSGALNLDWRGRLQAVAALATAFSALVGRPRAALVALAAFVAIDRPFLALLARRGGVRLALAGVPLHLLHQLVAVLAFGLAVVAHVAAGFPRRTGGPSNR